MSRGQEKLARAKEKARRRIPTIIERSLQFEVAPFPTRAAVQALRAGVIRLVHPLPLNG
jgi:hypothetical protein